MFQQREQLFGAGAATARLSMADALPAPATIRPGGGPDAARDSWTRALAFVRDTNWTPDLGTAIGSAEWFRGLATLCLLLTGAYAVWPGIHPLGAAATAPAPVALEELRSQMIMPLAFGSDSGRAMAATDAVVALAQAPERPTIELAAVIGRGDSFMRVMQRAGVGSGDAQSVANLVSSVVPLSDIRDGTRIDITLGRRFARNQPRPVESIAFRARFDMNVEIVRAGSTLDLVQKPILVDATPLRIRGTVGSSLYRSARAAGAPPRAIQAYLQTLGSQLSIGSDIRATDEFDIIVDYKRAATGEVEMGELLYAGLERGGKPQAQMLRWKAGSGMQWFEASGVGEERGEFARPVNGAVTSGYGYRRHPILGFRRMHSGIDFRARSGTPIYATADGVVNYSGRKGGYGNFVRIAHGGNIASGYGHMSRIAVSNGTRVRRGQVIGYVGSTGLSTGPHLHYELYRGGRAVDPGSVKFTTRAQLSGSELASFRARLKQLLAVSPGAALQSITPPSADTSAEPKREIERIASTTIA
ncbi:M23 family metallopeptidase [Blastomonas sp.]|uniref:M23 family metallopeptidase n=1 Tax=Blastomonas sp. TaxID=1909299 RepID=UPI00391B8380